MDDRIEVESRCDIPRLDFEVLPVGFSIVVLSKMGEAGGYVSGIDRRTNGLLTVSSVVTDGSYKINIFFQK